MTGDDNPPLGVPLERRARLCNGGPCGSASWCGASATHVGRDEQGLEWFCCERHTEGAGEKPGTRLLPIAEWFKKAGLT